jgi:hypothetical protein
VIFSFTLESSLPIIESVTLSVTFFALTTKLASSSILRNSSPSRFLSNEWPLRSTNNKLQVGEVAKASHRVRKTSQHARCGTERHRHKILNLGQSAMSCSRFWILWRRRIRLPGSPGYGS